MVLVAKKFDLVVDRPIAIAAAIFVLLVSVLMVSTVPYRSGKEFNLRQRWPATAFFLIAAVVAVLAFTTVPALALLLGAYLVAGPAEFVVRHLRRRTAAPPAPQNQVTSAINSSENPDHP
jgi:phosphatidylserine synthase